MSIPEKQSVVLFRETGGPEVLEFDTNFPTPLNLGSNEILIKNHYAGVNYIETYFRNGIYPCDKPYVLGREASGKVVARGSGITDLQFKVGDKVAYLSGKTFAQYTKVTVGAVKIIKLPENSLDEDLQLLAASLLQGLTALTFVEEAYAVKKDDYVLVWAASGGVGLLLDQLINRLGANVIAVASTEEKLQLAKENGARYGILNDDPQLLKKILEITNGKGVDAVFDSIGKATFETSFQAVKRKGTLVCFGNASGAVPPFSLNRLSAKNIKILRPQVTPYIAEQEEFEYYSTKLLQLIKAKKLNIKIHNVYDLKDYSSAARELESRKTTGKLLLRIPE